VEVGSNTSTVTLRVVGSDGKGSLEFGQCEGRSQKRAYVKRYISDDYSLRVETCCNLKVT
jgi:hypothetical protein